MRVLNNNELNQVAGSEMFGDLQAVWSDGISQSEKTFAVVALSAGILTGGVLSCFHKALAPIAALTILGGWYFYTCPHGEPQA